MAQSVVVPANQLCSSGFTLARGDRPFVVETASMAGAAVQLQCAGLDPTLAGSSDYKTVCVADTGVAATLVASAVVGWSAPLLAPTPYARILLGASTGAARSFAVHATLGG